MKKIKTALAEIKKPNNKVIVILGTTSSGKTSLGVHLANKFNGEIISADSRQVYKGMDIGTGKDLNEYIIKKKIKGRPRAKKIPYHLIDVVKPQTKFTLANYQKLAQKAVKDVLGRHKLPLIVGGTGLYLQAVVDDYKLIGTKPDAKVRQELEKLTVPELYAQLLKINKSFAEKLNNSDRHNPRRLVRYIEILSAQDNFKIETGAKAHSGKYNFLILGLDWPLEILKKRIYDRLIYRLEKQKMVAEIARLHKQGVSWKRLESFGLEYKFVSLYLQNQMTYEEMVEKLSTAIYQFSKRQKTWWRRWEKQGQKIEWVGSKKEAEKVIKNWK